MSNGELLLTLLVALLVFGPNKLPMLARDLGRFFAKIQKLKARIWQEWDANQSLAENEAKALVADQHYGANNSDVKEKED